MELNLPKLPELIFEDNKIVTILNNASNKSIPIPIKKKFEIYSLAKFKRDITITTNVIKKEYTAKQYSILFSFFISIKPALDNKKLPVSIKGIKI